MTADQFLEWVLWADRCDPDKTPEEHKRQIRGAFVEIMWGEVVDTRGCVIWTRPAQAPLWVLSRYSRGSFSAIASNCSAEKPVNVGISQSKNARLAVAWRTSRRKP